MTSDEIYRTQQFGKRTGFGKRPSLLVVDFVNGVADPQVLGGGNIRDEIAAAAPLLAFFRERKLPVIFTRVVYAEDGSDAGIWCKKAPRLRLLTESADVSQIVSELSPRAGELVVRKTQASAFFGTHLGSVLTSRGTDTLVVAGCTTSGCVRSSVVDAMSMNFRTVVATGPIGDTSNGPYEANLFDMGQKYADLLAVKEIIAVLDAQSYCVLVDAKSS
jgi:maleamate amidohydrolase